MIPPVGQPRSIPCPRRSIPDRQRDRVDFGEVSESCGWNTCTRAGEPASRAQVPVEDQLKYFYDVWGSDQTYNHMAVGWTWAFDTPFSWTKQIASHFGGIRQGMAISWTGHIKDVGGIRNQFHHVIDIVPTILEVTGIRAPETVNGIRQKPIEGVSMAYTFDKANANKPSTHHTQYFEMMGDHAIYHDGWMLSTKVIRPPWEVVGPVNQNPANNVTWELYDLSKDWTQANDVAAAHPDKVKDLAKLFLAEARKYEVLPLDASVATRLVQPRPNITAGQHERHRPGRYGRAQGRRHGSGHSEDGAYGAAHPAVGRDLRHRLRYWHAGGRPGLPGTVRVHRQAREADD